MDYSNPSGMSRQEVEAALERNLTEELSQLVVSVSLFSEEFSWAQRVCLRLSQHPDPEVRGNAMLGFGHLARRFGHLDSAIRPLLKGGLKDPEEYVRKQAYAAAMDTQQFLGWSYPELED